MAPQGDKAEASNFKVANFHCFNTLLVLCWLGSTCERAPCEAFSSSYLRFTFSACYMIYNISLLQSCSLQHQRELQESPQESCSRLQRWKDYMLLKNPSEAQKRQVVRHLQPYVHCCLRLLLEATLVSSRIIPSEISEMSSRWWTCNATLKIHGEAINRVDLKYCAIITFAAN